MNMKSISRIIVVFVFLSHNYSLYGQDTLPRFTVVNRNSKIILSWVNHYPVVKQLSIQRSSDSIKGFKTILTLPDPTSVTNGFLDNNAPNDSSYYKLYILLDNGEYVFSKAQKPHKYIPPLTQKTVTKTKPQDEHSIQVANTKPGPVIQEPDNLSAETDKKTYALQSASPASDKKKSSEIKAGDLNITRPQTFTPSSFVFTNPDGNITIVLPDGRFNNFGIKFYEESGNILFQINSIKEHIFIIDKSNFLRAGWFSFELYENGVMKEKSKVRVP